MRDPGDDNQQEAMDTGGFNHAEQEDNDQGGTHYTIQDTESGARYSWDTNKDGDVYNAHASYRDSTGNWRH